MSGPPTGTLLDLLEPGWRRHLASGEPAGTLDVEPEMLHAAAKALGSLSRSEPPTVLNCRWPACVVVAMAQITAHHDKNGKVWPTQLVVPDQGARTGRLDAAVGLFDWFDHGAVADSIAGGRGFVGCAEPDPVGHVP